MVVQKENRSLVVWLLISSFLIGLSWAALIPMWHTPDEQAHFAQAQNVMIGRKNQFLTFTTSRDIAQSEKYLRTFRINGNNEFIYHPEFNIHYGDSTIGGYEKEIMDFPIKFREDFVLTEASGYPPLYYWYIAGVNKLFWKSDLIMRVFISRIATVFLATAGSLVIFFLGCEFFKNQFYAITVAALATFHPMWRFVGSGVTSDVLWNIVYPLILLSILIVIRKPEGRNLVWLVLTTLVAIFVKPQAWLLVCFSIIMLLWFERIRVIKHSLLTGRLMRVGMILCIAFIVFQVFSSFVPGMTNFISLFIPVPVRLQYRGFGIPEILDIHVHDLSPFQYISAMKQELYKQTFPWFWGVYRWLSLTLPLFFYRIIKIVVLGSLLGWILGFKRRSSITRTPMSLTIVVFSMLWYAFGLLVWNFFYWRSHGYSFGIQGRYFFPNLPEQMIILFTGLLLLVPMGWRKLVAFCTSLAMILFHWYSLWFVSSSYYDSSNIQIFFLQASQYKPWFFKMPFLPIIIGMGLASSVWFSWKLGVKCFKGSRAKG